MGLFDMMRSIKEPKKKAYDIGHFVNVGMNWAEVLKPGDYITRAAYDYIRQNSRIRGCSNLLSGRVTPEYFQVLSDQRMSGSLQSKDGVCTGEIFHTFDFDIVNQIDYVYHGMCFLDGVANVANREVIIEPI